MRYDVALAACKSYEDAEVSAALETAVTAAGGLDWVTPGMRVALKLNLVSAMKPEEAATVHPAVVCALVRMLQARGAHVVLGDSPGGLYNAAHLQRVYDVTGLRAAEALGAELNGDFSVCSVSYPEAVQARSFTETAYLRNADAIIDVCKLKTHGMMGMTNAVKNFFGIIPGTMKPEYHYKYPKIEDFANMIVDLCEYCKPRLCICDAVVGMEGNGPTQGSARPIGCLLAAESPHALDLVACGLIGLRPDEVPTAVPGKPGGAAGLWRRGRAGRGGFPNGPLAGKRLFPQRREGAGREAGGQLPVPLADALSEAAREGVHRLPEVREHLPREGHHDAARQAAHRPQGLHPLLLLPGVLPEGRDAGRPERTDADFGEIKRENRRTAIAGCT